MPNYRAYVLGTMAGGALPWSFGLNFTGSLTESGFAADWNAAVTALVNGTSPLGIASLMVPDIVWSSTYVTTVNSTWHQTTKTSTALTGVVGTATGATLPLRTTEIVRLKTATANRRGRGRVRLPAFADSATSGHVMSSTAGTQLKSAFNNMMATLSGEGMSNVIFGTRAAKDGTPPYTLITVTSYDYPELFYTLRKRDHKLIPTLA